MRPRRLLLSAGRPLLVGVLVLGWLLGLVPGTAWTQGPPADVPADYIVQFREGTPAPQRAAAAARAGAVLRFNYDIVDAIAVHIPSAHALAALQTDPDVVEIIPDRPVFAHGKPEGPEGKPSGGGSGSTGQIVPAGVSRIGAAPGSVTFTGSNVGVAVVDTGVDFNHGDLTVGPKCFTAFTSCQDDNGHGTHVAGIVAAGDNSQDVVGVAAKATVYAVKVLDSSGSGTDSTVMAGLNWIGLNATLVSPPIRVVNMSLGRPGTLGDNSPLRDVFKALHNAGIAIVVSAGNDPKKEVSQMVPAIYPEVMAVASTTAKDGAAGSCGKILQDTASYFTTDGKYDTTTMIGVTISAPGEERENVSGCIIKTVGILSTKLGGGTTRMSGTSMAAPHVAGVVALMWQQALEHSGTLSPETARIRIRTCADRKTVAPLNSPTTSYSYDGEREGVVYAPAALTCP